MMVNLLRLVQKGGLKLFVQVWEDVRQRVILLTPLGLSMFNMLQLTPLRGKWPSSLRYSVDYDYRCDADVDELISDSMAEYAQSLSQQRQREGGLSLSTQWSDYIEYLKNHLRPEWIRDFRRNRICVGGYCAGGAILDEDIGMSEMVFSDNYAAAKYNIYRQQQGSAEENRFALSVVREFHLFSRSIDQGVLALLDEGNVGNPILTVHQGKHISLNLLIHAYYATNILRHIPIRLGAPFILCEIGGGYGGFAKVFKDVCKGVSYINFDLPESIALSTYYLKANYPDARFATISDFPVGEPLHRDRLLEYDFVLLPWWYIESLAPDTIDLFMNSASMQEMTREFIDYYIEHIQRAARGYFYWINRDMPPERYGGVQFQDYPLDDNWRTVYTTHSPIHLREWLALRS